MIKKIVSGILTIAVLFLVATSCRTVKPTAPAEIVLPYTAENSPSYIALTMETSIDQVETFLNHQFDGLIYEDMDLKNNGGDNLMVKAWKQSNIELALDDNELRYEIPLKLWVKYFYEGKTLGITISQPIEVEGAILLKFKTKFSIQPNWTVATTTTPTGYSWLKSPSLKFGPVDLPIGFIADNFLKNNQVPIAKAIDKIVAEQLNLRKYGDEAWKALSTPLKVNEEYNTWIVMHPMELYTIPVTSQKGKIIHQMSIKALSEVFVGQPPHQQTFAVPDMKIVDKVPQDFSVMLQTRLLYSEMRVIARKHVVGKTYEIGKRNITIKSVDVFPSAEKVALKAEVDGDLRGTLYFTGKPVYDTATAEIRLDDVDFDISTRNVLHKTASWLLGGVINKKISQQMVFPIQKELETARQQMNNYLQNNKLTPELTLQGKIHKIGFGNISILEDGLLIPVTLTGNLKVRFKTF
ncbi:MAG: DUF4403 family protein [Bacteroidales bacterium]|nr:DUF4403 family protein [Bacteroidales bacterium]MDD3665220.1 DUF4403 family protein [Bacteroidales bacterium]